MIVVTGALGFIGSRVLARLLREESPANLLAVDHPLVESKQPNQFSSVRFEDHAAFLQKLLGGELTPEIIIHMGACSSTTETNWDYLRQNNLEYSQKLWEWCAEKKRRLIYASSAATYGDGSLGFDDEADISRLKPLNLYGKSKQDFDLWVQERERKGGPKPVQCVGFKFFNVFGPGEGHKGKMASMAFHSFHQIRKNGQVRLFKSHRSDYEDGGQLRDFIYVEQVVDVILQCVKNSGISGLFNLGTGKAQSFRSLTEATFAALKIKPNIEFIPMPEELRNQYQYFTEAKMRKSANAGLILPQISLQDAVADYVEYLKRSESRPS